MHGHLNLSGSQNKKVDEKWWGWFTFFDTTSELWKLFVSFLLWMRGNLFDYTCEEFEISNFATDTPKCVPPQDDLQIMINKQFSNCVVMP